ncbi:hypothetical protein AN958_11535 [Leucoagaricus sp. SymC.cos]|nr:hypothetical protein AN958_11535 [Leucoagaricus sp. SymC.cos]
MPFDILVLSIGYTGLLVSKTLSRHRNRSKFTFALAGRSIRKLQRITSDPSLIDIPTFQVDLSDEIALRSLVSQFRVVINCTSRYYQLSLPVVRACVSQGVHYLDLTGELPLIMKSIAEFDSMPSIEGGKKSIVVHACGYESVPSDLCVWESARTLDKAFGLRIPLGCSKTSMELKAYVSRGTVSSAIGMLKDVPRDLIFQSLQPFCLSPISGPSNPSVRLLYSLRPQLDIVGSFFLLSYNNAAMVNRTWGLLQLYPCEGAYGIDFEYEEFLAMPYSWISVIISCVSLIIGWMLLYIPPALWLAQILLDNESINPQYEDLKNGYMVATNVTSATYKNQTMSARTVFKTKGGDAGYMGSAVTVTECAVLLVIAEAKLPFSQFKCSRVLTPATAFGSLLTENLKESGFYEIQSDILN